MTIAFTAPITELYSVGPTVARQLKKLGIVRAADVLFHLPSRYEDFSNVKSIAALAVGESVTVRGTVDQIENRRSFRRHLSITEALVSDKTGTIKAVWFNQPYLATTLKPADAVVLSGTLSADEYGFGFKNPSYEKLTSSRDRFPLHTGRLVPVYPTTAGLSARHFRLLVKQVLPLASRLPDWLPEETRERKKIPTLSDALTNVHFPPDQTTLTAARERLAFDELFLVQLYTLTNRRALASHSAPVIPISPALYRQFTASLPFKLTKAQERVAKEITVDLGSARPMARLVEGDVGSGKTVVATLAMLACARAGYQTLLLAPTEILASQHFTTISRLLEPFNVPVALLTRSEQCLSNRAEKQTRAGMQKLIAEGRVSVIVGTHALLAEHVQFARVGLTIVDEQHRFGVAQRRSLATKTGATTPHFLSMTATPIPRTLALTLAGDLDLSQIDELPVGRKAITTTIVEPGKRKETYERVRREVARGRQVFVLCPLIDPSDRLGVKSVTTEHEKLDREVFPDLPVGLLHGRLSPAARERVMRDFFENRTSILVTTTVVEVGIDVPNATIMMVEAAERFGLAQLHQLRGRVGRGASQSYCFLFTETTGPNTIERLQALVASQNGFALAEKDLELRGPGEILGTKQTGFPEFKVARLTDLPLVRRARSAADALLEKDSTLEKWPLLARRLASFTRSIHFE